MAIDRTVYCTFTDNVPTVPGQSFQQKCAELAVVGDAGPYTFELVPGIGDTNNYAFTIGDRVDNNTVALMTTAPWISGEKGYPQEADMPLAISVKCTDSKGKWIVRVVSVLDFSERSVAQWQRQRT